MLTVTIPAYTYIQYADDVNVSAFTTQYNAMAQTYVTWFATASLPVYTLQSGTLLDWVANGLYGQYRPTLGGQPATDDVFKRGITWAFYKGDGKTFTVRWLKRRLQRWLLGPNGIDPIVGQTYNISITFGTKPIEIVNNLSNFGEFNGGMFNTAQFDDSGKNWQLGFHTVGMQRIIYINLLVGQGNTFGGPLNTSEFNTAQFNGNFYDTSIASTLAEAINSGELQLPLQFLYIVRINP
jgi:hypothetical protein